MIIKKQILLPKSSFALANDEDVFINLQLNKTFSDIKTEKINNVFNINQQYNSERQTSLKFCIYGLVESLFSDTEDLIIQVRDSTNLTLNLPKISSDNITGKTLSIKTFELSSGSNGMSRNLYGKKKSAYSILFEINANELSALDAQILSSGGTPVTRTVDFTIIDSLKNIFYITSVPYLFYDLDGNPVKFGSQTADMDDDGNIIEINNDFPFLYDRHWVKQYLNLPAPSSAFFIDKIVSVPEKTIGEHQISVGLSAGTVYLNVAIDQPSPFGQEEATVILDLNNVVTAGQGKIGGSTVAVENQDFTFTPQIIKWNIGEQYKTFNLDIIDNKLVQNNRYLSFKITDFKYCLPKSDVDISMEVDIIDDDIASKLSFLHSGVTINNNVTTFAVSYIFDKPIEVPGQSAVLSCEIVAGMGKGSGNIGATSAIVGQDFILNAANPTSTDVNIYFNKGDISGSTNIRILHNASNTDKIFDLHFKNPSQNITLNNAGAFITPNNTFTAIINK